MARRTRTGPSTAAEWAAFDARLQELLARCKADEDMGRRAAEAWLAGRTHAEASARHGTEVHSDGRSVHIDGDCLVTW